MIDFFADVFAKLLGRWTVRSAKVNGGPQGEVVDRITIRSNMEMVSETAKKKVKIEKGSEGNEELFPGWWGWYKATVGDDLRYFALNKDGRLIIHRFNKEELEENNEFYGEKHHGYEVGKKCAY